MGNAGRVIAIIVVVLTAWVFWPMQPKPLGKLVLLEVKLDAARDPAKPLMIVLEPPIRLSTELLREIEPLGPCAGKACGAVDPRSRAIMMGKVCKGEPDCRPFSVPELPDLYVVSRVFSMDDGAVLKRELDAAYLGRSLSTSASETVTLRRVLTVDATR